MSSLLGFEDERIEKDPTDFKVNKVGGKPDWTSGNHANPNCKLCGKSMPLAVQIYAPLDGSRNHRTLYLFCCVHQKCHTQNGGWVCLRDETLDNSSLTQASHVSSSSVLPSANTWVEDADDWGDGSDEWGDSNERKGPIVETEESTMEVVQSTMERFNLKETKADSRISESSEEGASIAEKQAEVIIPTAEVEEMDACITLDDVDIKPSMNLRSLFMPSDVALEETSHLFFNSFYLSVCEEELTKGSTVAKLDQRAKQLLQEYQLKEKCDWTKGSSKQSSSSGTGEAYEKTRPTHGDELVHKFVSRVQAYPEQLLRYERDGTPLLYKTLGKFRGICKYCAAAQVFELQLMPHLSQKLSLSDELGIDCPIEIATVLIFTCSKSCWSDAGVREEFVIVQAEVY